MLKKIFRNNIPNNAAFICLDDWLQIEFVTRLKSHLNQAIHSEGFNQIDLETTKRLSTSHITLNDIFNYFDIKEQKILNAERVSIFDKNSKNRFYYVISDNYSLYGLADSNLEIEVMGIVMNHLITEDELSLLLGFCLKHNLLIIDWAKAVVIDKTYIREYEHI